MRIKEIIRVAVVVGGAIAGAASATSGQNASDCKPGQVCGFQSVPPYTRNHTVKTETAIDGVEIEAKQDAATSWRVFVRNTAGGAIRIMWDESSFVASTTESMGRLIRGETRKMDVEKPQTPTPIAPGATISQFVLVEKMLDAEELEAELAKSDARLIDMTAVYATRKARNKAIKGGKIYIVVDVAGEKKTWTGAVE